MNPPRDGGSSSSWRTWMLVVWVVVLAAACSPVSGLAEATKAPQFSIAFAKSLSAQPLDGRVLLLLSNDPSAEPRMQINDTPRSQMVFGIDVDGLKPEQAVTVNETAFGYPIRSLGDVPAGEYYVQAFLHRYETFHRADGKKVKLPMDRGEGQQWNLAPGNLYSRPLKIKITGDNAPVSIVMDQEIPPIPPIKDTKYIRHISIQSQLLTKFWGRPMYLSAIVLVPEGFDEHANAHYPLAIFHDHFVGDFDNFRTEPPDPNLKPDYSERFHISGYTRIQQEEAY